MKTLSKKFISLYNSAKIITIDQDFQSYDHKCTATFYGSQCIMCPERGDKMITV